MLARAGINADAYSLDGNDGVGERYVMGGRDGGWKTCYAERGVEQGRRDFDTEDEACRDLLDRLRRDETTHLRLVVGPLRADDADRSFAEWKAARPSLTLGPQDVRIDDPIFRAEDGSVRRYWVRGSKLVAGDQDVPDQRA